MKYFDFTLNIARNSLCLLNSDKIINNQYEGVHIRHDIDRLPKNALTMARIEAEKGLLGTYYFRTKPHVFKPEIIREIAALGHEIGYHYENMADCGGDPKKAIEDFKRNLDRLREIVPIRSICMHGSPMSKYDNRDLWKYYDYRDYGIEFEPYFDVDYSEVFYLTDTGRRWDGASVSIRDKVDQDAGKWPRYHTTADIIQALKEGTFPQKAMITIHPHRWHDNMLLWTWELVSQNIKNLAKAMIVRRMKRG